MATNYVKNVSFSDPYSAEQSEIARRRKLAELMQQQGQTPLGPTENIGGWAVKRSPMEGIGKIAQSLSGAYQQNQATEMQKALADRIRSERQQDYQTLMGAQLGQPAIPEPSAEAGGGPGREAIAPTGINPALIAQLRSPEVQQMAAQQMMEANKPRQIGSGGLYMPGGQVVPPATRPQGPQSIGAGGLRLPDGTIVPPVQRPPSQSNLSRLMAERNTLLPNDPRRATYDNAIRKESETARQISPTIVMPRPEQPPVVQKDDQGNVRLYDRRGNLIKDLGKVGTPSAQVQKTAIAKQQLSRDISKAISELETATADGGLIDKSTGSGIGAAVDYAGSLVGHATPGAIAAGSMAPIFDLVLKMVPRFEGPQSEKDTESYERAAGQLANPAVPNAQKKAAGKEILRLMKARQAQFISKDMIGMEPDVGAAPTNVDQLLNKYK